MPKATFSYTSRAYTGIAELLAGIVIVIGGAGLIAMASLVA